MDKLCALHPLTNSGHILLGPIDRMLSGVRMHLESLYARAGPTGAPVPVGTDLAGALAFLRSAVDGPFPSRFLLLPAQGAHTVVFNNAWRSQGLFSMARALTITTKVEDIFFRAQPNTIHKGNDRLRGQYGAYQLIRVADGQIVRLIELVNDGGRWSFATRGEPFSFEDTNQYHAPKKVNRLTEELLKKYLTAMNMFPFREEFYTVHRGQPAVGIEINISQPQELARLDPKPLEKIQDEYGPFD